MKILLIELNGTDPDFIFQDERLETIRRLMTLGCFGILQSLPPSELPPDRIAEVVIQEAGRVVVIDGHTLDVEPELLFTAVRVQFERARQAVQYPTWEYLRIAYTALMSLSHVSRLDSDLISSLYLNLDEQIGKVIELLDEDTLIVLLSSFGIHCPDGCFIIAAPNNPVRGEMKNLHLFDIAPTVLQLAGYTLPPNLPGKSLVEDLGLDDFSSTELSEEEEAILRERLSGLGYI
jgi:hypothetical protein